MKSKWIIDRFSNISEDDLTEKILSLCGEGKLFLAYCSDSFLAGHAVSEEMSQIIVSKLLELRVFDKDCETLYVRSGLNRDFSGRTASEKNIGEDDYLTMYQTIDINQKYREHENYPIDDFGNAELLSTVGGSYVLPIGKDENSAEIIAYLDYDDNGMAKISDYRVRGFCKREMLTLEVTGE